MEVLPSHQHAISSDTVHLSKGGGEQREAELSNFRTVSISTIILSTSSFKTRHLPLKTQSCIVKFIEEQSLVSVCAALFAEM